ncbi:MULTISPECIES: CHAP domain-containing protein [Aerococcus]|uniref:CHAP domain-containing protein n=1 Tax=Aerococcus mictus TaxID=2976810 RepID=A0ABZ2ECI1_9LACT|nr:MULTISPECIES: CHAP domain-containing protein [Aerococcus]AEA01749.1 Cpl-7 lysozyme C-terminal domain protein [Aerococcus sp. Group 1]KAA9290053.1 CHAP domain-containing protein [Aerococcus mictus]MCY3055023.1 CHAP domain-containing protein [Aerococcus sp. Group 1]MCY3056777.1 CHAP domain-containing protein [Aerococcus sp. Group 1]MCY3062735.1 CHAP domain-containing protein [Aerococcus sp. Group 1]
MVTAQQVLKTAQKYLGMTMGSTSHRAMVDRYNRVLPRPVGYVAKYSDDWCDIFVTAVGDEAGATDLIGRECGVQRHIHVFAGLGIWLGQVYPQAGDIVCFDWDGGGFADHIGFVEAVTGSTITTIEGNASRRVARNRFAWNDWQIKGYARPKYGRVRKGADKTVDQLAQEVLDRQWGNGADRKQRLESAGYDYQLVQDRVNQLVAQRNLGEGKTESVEVGASVRVADWATHWQTGQKIADWVKGQVFAVMARKPIDHPQSDWAYLLSNRGVAIGWLLSQDVAA